MYRRRDLIAVVVDAARRVIGPEIQSIPDMVRHSRSRSTRRLSPQGMTARARSSSIRSRSPSSVTTVLPILP